MVNPRGATGPHADVRRTPIAVRQVLHTKLKSFPSLEEISALADELHPFFSQTAVIPPPLSLPPAHTGVEHSVPPSLASPYSTRATM